MFFLSGYSNVGFLLVWLLNQVYAKTAQEIRRALTDLGVLDCIDIKTCRIDPEPGDPVPTHCSAYLHFRTRAEAYFMSVK